MQECLFFFSMEPLLVVSYFLSDKITVVLRQRNLHCLKLLEVSYILYTQCVVHL